MSNFLLKNPYCVLIHIPKTGGTSIRKGAWEKNYDGPFFGEVPDQWQKYYKFAFVRNPFDRFVSAWKMFTIGTIGDDEWRLPKDHRTLTIESFFDIVKDETIIYDQRRKTFEEKIRHHTIPQTHPFNCLHLADFVGRFENLNQDFQKITNHLNVKLNLPKIHYTKHDTWQKEIPTALKKELKTFYKNDFVELGY